MRILKAERVSAKWRRLLLRELYAFPLEARPSTLFSTRVVDLKVPFARQGRLIDD